MVPLLYFNGSLFLENLVFVWVYFQIPPQHILLQILSTPSPKKYIICISSQVSSIDTALAFGAWGCVSESCQVLCSREKKMLEIPFNKQENHCYLSRGNSYETRGADQQLKAAHPVNYFSRFLGKNIKFCPPSKLFLFTSLEVNESK